MSGVTNSPQPNKKRPRRIDPVTRRYYGDTESSAHGTLQQASRFYAKHRTRIIPDVSGFNILNKTEVKRDLKNIEKSNYFTETISDLSDSDAEEEVRNAKTNVLDGQGIITRSMRPKCGPESTLDHKKRRYSAWTEKNAQGGEENELDKLLEEDISQLRAAIQVLQYALATVNQTQERKLQAFEYFRQQLTLYASAIREKNHLLTSQARVLYSLCSEEVIAANRKRNTKSVSLNDILNELQTRAEELSSSTEAYEKVVSQHNTAEKPQRKNTLGTKLAPVIHLELPAQSLDRSGALAVPATTLSEYIQCMDKAIRMNEASCGNVYHILKAQQGEESATSPDEKLLFEQLKAIVTASTEARQVIEPLNALLRECLALRSAPVPVLDEKSLVEELHRVLSTEKNDGTCGEGEAAVVPSESATTEIVDSVSATQGNPIMLLASAYPQGSSAMRGGYPAVTEAPSLSEKTPLILSILSRYPDYYAGFVTCDETTPADGHSTTAAAVVPAELVSEENAYMEKLSLLSKILYQQNRYRAVTQRTVEWEKQSVKAKQVLQRVEVSEKQLDDEILWENQSMGPPSLPAMPLTAAVSDVTDGNTAPATPSQDSVDSGDAASKGKSGGSKSKSSSSSRRSSRK